LSDGRLFSDLIAVMARRGANIDSDHMLVVIKLRARICRAINTKPQKLRRFAVDRLKDNFVASRYYDWKKQSRKKRQTPSATRENKQIKSSLTRSVQRRTRKRTPPESKHSTPKPEEPRMLIKLARTKERRLFKKKKARQLDEEALKRD
jgi:hypothetical protein